MNSSISEFGLTPEELHLTEVFHPYALREMRRVRDCGARFAYYTSAATAVSILQNQEIWLRNITEMNDFAEIDYGVDCLSSALKLHRQRFDNLFDTRFPGFTEKLIASFNERLPQLQKASYICCVSEHQASEDNLGRLSMWRAYGGNAGVALIFKSGAFLNSQSNFGAYSTPVAYPSHEEMGAQLGEILGNIEEAAEMVVNFPEQYVAETLLNVFEMAAISTKHPGFKEEQEWRIFYRPTLDEFHRAEYSIKTISGIPQGVYKLKLENRPDEGVTGFTIKDNIERIIVGPTDHAFVVRDALASCLRKLEIENALDLVVESKIPLRVPY